MQKDVWEREYQNPKFLTKADKPQNDILRFVKFLKKKEFTFKSIKVLDLGCGTGRNSNFFAGLGADVVGIDISKTAIGLAKERAVEEGLNVSYILDTIGKNLPFEDNVFDIILDVTSSNSLDEKEREIYIEEVNRVLKKDGIFFFKGLCLEADQNAKQLIKTSPGKEKDTYFIKEIGLTEKVWSKEDLISFYRKYFKFDHLERKTSYLQIGGRLYKRNFWIAYLTKN